MREDETAPGAAGTCSPGFSGADVHARHGPAGGEVRHSGSQRQAVGSCPELADYCDPARNRFGATDPYEALELMSVRLNQALSAPRARLTPLYWQTAAEYSMLSRHVDDESLRAWPGGALKQPRP